MAFLNREKILSGYQVSEERWLMARVLDQVEIVLKKHMPMVTDFYDPFHTTMIVTALKSLSDLNVAVDGGYAHAERSRVLIYPDYLPREEINPEIAYLKLTGQFKMVKVGHRDVLGAIMGLGLKREKVGDIIIGENEVHLMVDKQIGSFLMNHLVKVGRLGVTVKELSLDELMLPEHKIKQIKATVSALRLDSVAAAGYGTSRTKQLELIKSEKISINWCCCNNPSAQLKEGDMLSCRGVGRVKLVKVEGKTKSGRISLVLHRYL